VDLEKDVVPKDWKPISEMDKKLMEFCKLFVSKVDGPAHLFLQMGSQRTMRMLS
jgi:hypothetical protein